MSISFGGFRVRAPEQPSNCGKAKSRVCTDAREGISQAVKPKADQIRGLVNQCPRSLQVGSGRFIVSAADDKLSDPR